MDSCVEIQSLGNRMISILDLKASPVGVKLLSDEGNSPQQAVRLRRHRYCQALMKARQGEHVLLDREGIACPAAAAAFGFRELPDGLRNGKGLVGFGIVTKPETGQRMFENMPALFPGQIHQLYLFPLNRANTWPDVVVVEDEVEKLMWINLAYLNATGGERVSSSTAVLQASCVDSTILPYLEDRLNFGYGCYGCRDATDLGSSETVVGFPGRILTAIAENLECLGRKAIPNSRAKKAYAALS